MNLADRNIEIGKALALSQQIDSLELQLDGCDEKEGAVKTALKEANEECNALIRKAQGTPRVSRRGEGPSRIMELFDLIHELQQKLNALAHEPSTIQNTLRRLGSDFAGYASRDWQWLKNWRIGRERGMGGPVDVEDKGHCKAWMVQVRRHADTFLSDSAANSFYAESKAKLARRRSELAAGRARNAETDANAARMQAEVVAERERRAEETRERLKESDRERADYRAKLDREMAAEKVAASLAFDRRVARKEVKRHAWLTKYWQKIAKARDDKEFRDAWIAKVSAKNAERAKDLRKVFRSAGDSASALRGAVQFDLVRKRWAKVVELLDADPALTMDEAEGLADPEYREQRAEIRERDEALLAANLAAQIKAAGQ